MWWCRSRWLRKIEKVSTCREDVHAWHVVFEECKAKVGQVAPPLGIDVLDIGIATDLRFLY